jgi:hypothetical protein
MPLAPRGIGWMVRINRPAIRADVEQIAVSLEPFLAMAVTVRTQRLQLSVFEQPCIALVGDDMVRHRSGGGDLPLQAHGTQGIFPELQPGPTLPAPRVVKMVPATSLL